MRVEHASAEDVRAVALNMRVRDLEEFSALYPCDTREELADVLAERYGGRDDVLCAREGNAPVCIGGTIETRPGVMTVLFFATEDFPKIAVSLTRFIRRELFPRYFDAGVHRIEAVSLASYGIVHNWLHALGFAPETGPLLGYGKRGEPFMLFSQVRDVRKASA